MLDKLVSFARGHNRVFSISSPIEFAEKSRERIDYLLGQVNEEAVLKDSSNSAAQIFIIF